MVSCLGQSDKNLAEDENKEPKAFKDIQKDIQVAALFNQRRKLRSNFRTSHGPITRELFRSGKDDIGSSLSVMSLRTSFDESMSKIY